MFDHSLFGSPLEEDDIMGFQQSRPNFGENKETDEEHNPKCEYDAEILKKYKMDMITI